MRIGVARTKSNMVTWRLKNKDVKCDYGERQIDEPICTKNPAICFMDYLI
jgi:hypothetical protein